MLIQNDFRRQFYEEIKKQHVLVIVNTDVDALCATAILTHILSCDEVTYSLIPVDSFDRLKEAIQIHGKQVKHIILINCVGQNSVTEIDLEENTTIWLIESQRPIHLDNVYSADTVKVIVGNGELEDDEWQIPDAEQIYEKEEEEESSDGDEEDEGEDYEDDDETMQEDEEENEDEEVVDDSEADENDGDGTNGNGKRPKSRGKTAAGPKGKRPKRRRRREDLANIIGRRALKRQQRAQWKRTRGTLLWEYYMKSWYAAPVSVFLLELAHELGKSNAEMMWCTAVGISSQLMDKLVSLEKYTEVCTDRMGPFIRKFGPRAGVSAEQTRNLLRISFNRELTLPLYSHWSLYESMSNESMFICQSKMWSQRGEEKFKEILAQLGLTLAECNQNFEAIKKERRKEIFEILLKHLDTGFASFKTHLGYTAGYNAVDFARVISLQLEYRQPRKGIRSIECANTELARRFELANGLLREFFKTGGRDMHATLGQMIEQYKMALRHLNELVKRSIVQKHVVMRSRYFLLTISEQCPILGYFSSRHFLFHFAHSMLHAHASQAKTSSRIKPFVLAIPMPKDEEDGQNAGWYLITGLMPLTELVADTSRKSILGSAFRHVAKEANIQIRQCLDSNVIMIKAMDRLRFFNILDARLESA